MKKSVAVLCRYNEVANKLTDIFFEKNLHPRSVTDIGEMTKINKHIKKCLEPVQLKYKVGSLLAIASLCTMNKKIDGEHADLLFLLDAQTLSRKKKPLLKAINSIIKPYYINESPEICFDVIAQILDLLGDQDSITLNYACQRYVEHCIRIKDLTSNIIDNIMMQRQYIDSFTNTSSGLYITTIHQAKGKEFDCVFIVDIDNIVKEEQLLYVATSRMKEALYPIKINYVGVSYQR
jgi:hypothetical protein